jgi:hypothetical protein
LQIFLFQNLTTGVCSVGLSSTVQFFNPACLELLILLDFLSRIFTNTTMAACLFEKHAKASSHCEFFLKLSTARVQLHLQSMLEPHLTGGAYIRVVAEQIFASVETKAHAVGEVENVDKVSDGAILALVLAAEEQLIYEKSVLVQ